MDSSTKLSAIAGDESVQSTSVEPSDDIKPEDLVHSLCDEYSRRILQVVDDEPHTASEIASAADIPLSTTYRKINTLIELGFLAEQIRLSSSGHHAQEYSRPVEAVRVSFGSEIDVKLEY